MFKVNDKIKHSVTNHGYRPGSKKHHTSTDYDGVIINLGKTEKKVQVKLFLDGKEFIKWVNKETIRKVD